MKKDTSWGKVANWYDTVVEDESSFQNKVISPNIFRILNIQKGEKILDLACGQGIFANQMVTNGAKVVGVDLGEALIKIAKEKYKNIDFRVAKVPEGLNIFDFKNEADKFDKVVCVLALQNIKDLSGTIKEVAKLLKKGGKFVFVINHPAYRIPQASTWGIDKEKKLQYRIVEKYMTESSIEIDMNPSKKINKEKTLSFHRPLQSYFKLLTNNNFLIARVEEWISHRESQVGPNKEIEDVSRREFPLFMMIEAVKS